jgi:hypothetical protein
MINSKEKNNDVLRKPSILFKKMVFKHIIETKGKVKFRTKLYENLDKKLGYGKMSHETYRTWFSEPSRIVSKDSSFYNLLADALLATLLEQNQEINKITNELIEYHEQEMRNKGV